MPSVIDGTDNFSTDTDLVALVGADLTAVGIVGTNPYASLCKRDGSIVGGSDNGKFTMYANGKLECETIYTSVRNGFTSKGNIYGINTAQIVVFCKTFISTPLVTDATRNTGFGGFGSISSFSTTGCTISVFGYHSSSSAIPNCTATGRWK